VELEEQIAITNVGIIAMGKIAHITVINNLDMLMAYRMFVEVHKSLRRRLGNELIKIPSYSLAIDLSLSTNFL
jgi:hypothetical protein